MQSLSRTTWSRKVLPMVLDTARPKYKENTTWIGMRGRNAVRKSIPKVNILQVFMIDFSEIQFIVNHKSQSDGQNKSAKSGMNLHKKTIHVISLQRKGKIQKTMVSYSKQSRQKCVYETSIWFSSRYLHEKRLHHESGEQVEEPIHPGQQRRIQQGQEVFSEDYLSSARVDQHTGWEYWTSSTSSS